MTGVELDEPVSARSLPDGLGEETGAAAADEVDDDGAGVAGVELAGVELAGVDGGVDAGVVAGGLDGGVDGTGQPVAVFVSSSLYWEPSPAVTTRWTDWLLWVGSLKSWWNVLLKSWSTVSESSPWTVTLTWLVALPL